MELVYATEKIKQQCTNIKAAQKLFDRNALLSRFLLSRINALKAADTIKDIIVEITEVSKHYD